MFAEIHVEEAALAWLEELGYDTANGIDIGPDGNQPERANYEKPRSSAGRRSGLHHLRGLHHPGRR
jgi:hypothetical protein